MAEHKEVTTIERIIACRFCGSTNLSKYGTYKGTQYYICNDCGRKSAGTETYPRMKYEKDLIVKALTYYYNGMSGRNIAHTFNDILDIDISQPTIWSWIIKYSDMVNKFTLLLEPSLSDIWIADETAVSIWGDQYWFWDIIDTDTRFLIASHLSRTRTIDDATKQYILSLLGEKQWNRINNDFPTNLISS